MPVKTVVNKIMPSYSVKPCRAPNEQDKKEIVRLGRYITGTLVNGEEHPIAGNHLKMFSDFGIAGNETSEYIIPFNEEVSIPLGLVREIDSLKVREIGFEPNMKANERGLLSDGDRMVVINKHPRCRFIRSSEVVM